MKRERVVYCGMWYYGMVREGAAGVLLQHVSSTVVATSEVHSTAETLITIHRVLPEVNSL